MEQAPPNPHLVRRAHRRSETLPELGRLGAVGSTERRVRAITPWVVSLMVHLGAVAIAVAITWTVLRLKVPEDPVLIVADFESLAYDPVRPLGAAAGMPAPSGDPTLPAPADDPLRDALAPSDDPVLALAPPASTIGQVPTTAEAALTVPATFAGLRASNARRVVFVVDASGSMIGKLPAIVDELAHSLRSMVPQQEFAIVFFQRNEALAVPPRERLVPARAAEQASAIAWIRRNVIPTGRSNPLRAIEAALRLRPDVVFMLSSNITGAGEFEIDQSELLDMLDRLNPIEPASGLRRTQIQCVQFLDEDPLETLKLIAGQHGGPDGYRFISRDVFEGMRP